MNNPTGVVLVENYLISTYMSQMIVHNTTKQIILNKTLIQYTQNGKKLSMDFLFKEDYQLMLSWVLSLKILGYVIYNNLINYLLFKRA